MATLCKPRKKAFLGAVISAGASLLGGVATGIANKKAAKKQEALAKQEARNLELRNKSAYFANADIQAEERLKGYEQESLYANGGKTKIDNTIKITDGGYAKPIAKDTYKLIGRKHSSGGIGIKTKADEIEAESGEVIVKDGNDLKILSDAIVDSNGKTPSDKVMSNPSKDKAKQEFNNQESMKKAKLGDKLKIKNTSDVVEQGIALAAPLVSGIIGATTANKLKAPTKPELIQAPKLKTTVNTGATKSQVEQDYKDLDRAIESNTGSSATSLARRRRNLAGKTAQMRSIDETARNRETELINRDLLNRQSVNAANTATVNQYNRDLVDFQNRQTLGKAEAFNQMVGAGRDAVLDIQNRKDLDRYNQARLDIANKLSTRPVAKEVSVDKPVSYDFSRIDTDLLAKRKKPVKLPTSLMACGGKVKRKK